jgi:outer membrane protein TolC
VLSLTLDDAIDIALARAYSIRAGKLDLDDASWQLKGGYGEFYPQLALSSAYTRNLVTANPFAGSDAGGFFETLGFLDWLAYNEDVRTDADPDTNPITLGEFRDRQQEGIDEAGIVLSSSSNPFAVDNQVTNRLTITQFLWDTRVVTAVSAAKKFKRMQEAAYAREAQVVAGQVRTAFYGTLLAMEQAHVVANSAARIGSTLEETEKRVAQGVASKYERLSAEVELANIETNLIQSDNAVEEALDNLKFLLGIPVEQRVVLRGSLETDMDQGSLVQTASLEDALRRAMIQRPDLEQAALSVQLNRIRMDIEKSQRYPALSAFVDIAVLGTIPDNRTSVFSESDDPFTFRSTQRGVFDGSYWNPSVAVGIQLSWNIFNGFQTRAAVQRAKIQQDRAELRREQLEQSIQTDVERARRNLFAADQRIASQQQNVSRAELNYTYASTRLREGVSSPLEERQASELLDQAKLNYYQAIFDYLVAQSDFQTAVGTSVAGSDDLHMTGVLKDDLYGHGHQ